ncbi:MAG: iron ABC transporter permease [Acidobacteria bacterium]|nr:iron ABC transporter permease [Acidobacteriota bacterium]MBI3657054.1 iron ABC transporter permease [Acidobacteriota bacterium]
MRVEILNRQWTARSTIGLAGVLVFALSISPVLYMFVRSLEHNGQFTLAYYAQLLGEPRQRRLLGHSIQLAAWAALAGSALGVPAGLLLARLPQATALLLRFVLLVPLLLPPYILGVVWVFVMGRAGWLSRWMGSDVASVWAYSLPGAGLVLGLALAPLSMLLAEAARRAIPARLIEAARLVAGPSRTLARITLPLVASSLAAGGLLVFVLALAEFGVPSLLGVRVYTTEVFTQFAALYNFGAATATAAPLLLVVVVAAGLARILLGGRVLTSSLMAEQPLRLSSPARVAAQSYLILLGLLMVAGPLLVLMVEAGSWRALLDALVSARIQIGTSIALSIIGASLATGLGLLLGYWRARTTSGGRGFFDVGMLVLFAVPSTVVGIGLIGLWNRTGWTGAFYTSPAMIIIGYLARYVPLAALLLGAYLQQLPAAREEAAIVFGAHWWRMLGRIVVPAARLGLAVIWTICFIFMFGELGTTVLVAPPGTTTLPVRVYAIMANSPDQRVAELCLMQTLVILLSLGGLLAAVQVAGRRQKNGGKVDE